MTDIEKVVTRTRTIEKLLRLQYHAEGEGLHELITSCEERLPHDMVNKLRYIATCRNQVVNGNDAKLEDQHQFIVMCNDCEKELTPRSSLFIWRVAILLMMVMTLAAIGFYYANWDVLSLHLFSN